MDNKDHPVDRCAPAIRSLAAADPKLLGKRRALLFTTATEDGRLTRTDIIVFGRLQSFTDWRKHGYCFLRYEVIAAGKRGAKPVSRRAVADSLKRLEKYGYIISQQRRWRGLQAANRYTFPELVPECKAECNSECRSECTDQSAKQDAIPSACCLHSQEEVIPEDRSEESPLSPLKLPAMSQGELLSAEPKRKKKASALPDDFEVPQLWRDWAAERNPKFAGMVDHEAHKFRSHWLSTGGTRKNWRMCWEKWWAIALERAPRTYGLLPTARDRHLEEVRKAREIMAQAEAKGISR